MGKRAGDVRVGFIADSSEFRQETRKTLTRLQKLKRDVNGIARSMRRSWKGVTAAFAGIGAAIAIGIKDMASYSAKVVEVSRNVGTTTKTLENFRAVMVGDGLGVRQADKALEAFNRRVGQARMGTGEAAKSFEALGISLNRPDGQPKSIDELLKETTEALAGMTDRQSAAAHAANMFSDVGKRMVATLMRMGASYDEAMEAAGRYHTLTDEQHEANKDLDQSFTDMGANLLDFKNRILAQFAPQIEAIVKDFNEWIDSMKDTGGIETFITKLREISTLIARIAGAIGGLMIGASLGSLGGPVGALVGASLGSMAGLFSPEIASMITSYVKDHFGVASFDEQIGKLQDEQQGLRDKLGGKTRHTAWGVFPLHPNDKRAAEKRIKEIEGEIAKLVLAKRNFDVAMAGGEPDGSGSDSSSSNESPQEAIAKLKRNPRNDRWWRERFDYEHRKRTMGDAWHRQPYIQMGTLVPKSIHKPYVRPMMRPEERLQIYRDSAQGIFKSDKNPLTMEPWKPKELEESLDRLRPILDSMRGAFERLGDSILDGFKGGSEAVRQFGRELIKIGWRRMVVNPLADSLFGKAGDAKDGGLLGGLFSGFFANGGLAPRGMAVVGERGPELVDFTSPGRVYSTEQLGMAMRGGGGMTFNLNVNSTDGPGVMAAWQAVKPDFVATAKAAMAEDTRRPGALRQSMRGRY